MTSTKNFVTSTETFRSMFGNDLTYCIPRFQRDYSWAEEEWLELWQDITNLRSGQDPVHYMGYLVLKSTDAKKVDVIDGQQRLTTLSLLVLAVLRSLNDLISQGVEPANNELRLKQLRSTYIGYLDPVSLASKNKLILNRHNDDFYRERLVPLQKLPTKGLKAPERHLKRAFEWFSERIQEEYSGQQSGGELARFLDDLADKLLFTAIYVTDDLNAYKVFETLNARGVRLSPTDLLKNYLFSVVDKLDTDGLNLDALEARWDGIVEQLGSDNFSDFLRVHWNSRHEFVREAELFKTISGQVQNSAQVFDLIREMKDDLNAYVTLVNPRDEPAGDRRRYLEHLNLYGIRQLLSLLLAAKRVLSENDFTGLLRACAVITFRYTIIGGLANNLLESTYSSASKKLASGQSASLHDILQDLKPIYQSDEQFKQAFSERELITKGRGSRLARHILFAIERHVSTVDFSVDSADYSIEHILPEKPDTEWPQFSPEDHQDNLFRLGNLTLLEIGMNKAIGNKKWDVKREKYPQSSFAITKHVGTTYSHWTPTQVKSRQDWLASKANSIWRVSQFDP